MPYPDYSGLPEGFDPSALDQILAGAAAGSSDVPGYYSGGTAAWGPAPSGGTPQPWAAPAAPQAPGVPGATPTTAAPSSGNSSVNLKAPGTGEAWFKDHSSAYEQPTLASGWAQSTLPGLQAPGAFEQYWNGVSGQFGQPPGTQNRADQAYKAWEKNRPDIEKDPGLGGYYKDAEARASDTLSAEAAARGGYGSSVALGEVGKAIGGLEAERANREADYNLRRAGEIRNQGALSGQLARGGDITDQGNMDAMRQWLATGGALAGDAQSAGLARATTGAGIANAADTGTTTRAVAGQNAANSSEGLALQRIGQLLGIDMSAFGVLNNTAGGTYDDLISNDQALFGQQVGAPVAAASQDARAQSEQDAKTTQAIKDILAAAQKGGPLNPASAPVPGR